MQNHLGEVTIHAFRRLRSVSLAQLGSVNLIVGGNNSGKTSVLEAIATFCMPFDLREWIAAIRQRETKPISQIIEDDLRWLFAQDESQSSPDIRGVNHVSGSGAFTVRELIAQYKRVTGEFTDREQVDVDEHGAPIYELTTSEQVGAEIDIEVRTVRNSDNGNTPLAHRQRVTLWSMNPFEVEIPAFADQSLRVRTISPFSHQNERLQITQLSEAIETGWKEKVVDLLVKIDPLIAGLEIIAPTGGRAQVAIRHAKLGVMPLSAFGDGVRRVLLFALTVPAISNGLLLIDEIENAIHISSISQVFSWLVDACRAYSVQLIATTHSLEAVDALLSANINAEDIVGYRLMQNRSEQSAHRFSGSVLQHLRLERGLDVRWR